MIMGNFYAHELQIFLVCFFKICIKKSNKCTNKMDSIYITQSLCKFES